MPLCLRKSTSKKLCFLFFLGLLGLAGCDSSARALVDGGEEQVSHTPATQKKEVIVPSHQNPGASVRLLTKQIFMETVGEVISSELKLQVAHPRGSVSILFAKVEELDVLGVKDVGLIDLGALDSGDAGIISLSINLYASEEGRHYLPLSAIVVLPSGQRLHRSMSVVVQVGKRLDKQGLVWGARKKDGLSVIRTPGERLIKILPATETVY